MEGLVAFSNPHDHSPSIQWRPTVAKDSEVKIQKQQNKRYYVSVLLAWFHSSVQKLWQSKQQCESCNYGVLWWIRLLDDTTQAVWWRVFFLSVVFLKSCLRPVGSLYLCERPEQSCWWENVARSFINIVMSSNIVRSEFLIFCKPSL